jgi:hypothetical protein
MNTEERRRLLGELETLAHREGELVPDPVRVFLPLPSHQLALRPEIVVIRGGRGAGKSALFGLLGRFESTSKLRGFFGDDRIPEATWLEAFAQSAKHPQESVLDGFAKAGADEQALRAFWMAHLLLRVLAEEGDLGTAPADLTLAWTQHPGQPEAWVPLAQRRLGEVASALDGVERALEAKGALLFARYDHLDRIGSFDPDVRRKYVSALLALWLSYSNRYKRLRAKIFLRNDLLDAGELGFPDASKLRPRSTSLDWDAESLYRAAVRHMTAVPGLLAWLRDVKGLDLEDREEWGLMPGPMPDRIQKAVADRLAGELMGTGARKGYTFRWIINHLKDAEGRVVPRSFLTLLGEAAKLARVKPLGAGKRLLKPQNLVEALAATSEARVGEIKEEYKLVARLENLRGKRLLLPRETVVAHVGRPTAGEPPGLPTDGEPVFEELRRLGVVSLRSDKRVDVPDIYRSGFGILRKGGAAKD